VILEALLAVALVAALLALLVAVLAQSRVRQLRKAYSLLQGDAEHSSFIVAVARKTAEMERLRDQVDRLRTEVAVVRGSLNDSIRRVAVLHFDAFGDMGGRLSWTVALLDESGNGVVVTSIAARTEARAYAKPVVGGKTEHGFSPEEEQVVRAALHGGRVTAA
jgi:uncharacterized protein YlxW (UPF0749 family)